MKETWFDEILRKNVNQYTALIALYPDMGSYISAEGWKPNDAASRLRWWGESLQSGVKFHQTASVCASERLQWCHCAVMQNGT